MATRAPVYLYGSKGLSSRDIVTVTWSSIASGDTCDPAEIPEYGDMSVQYICGTWGAATLTVQGSNDATNYHTLNDALGVAISKTANGLSQILENSLKIKPVVTGAGLTGLAVTIIGRKL